MKRFLILLCLILALSLPISASTVGGQEVVNLPTSILDIPKENILYQAKALTTTKGSLTVNWQGGREPSINLDRPVKMYGNTLYITSDVVKYLLYTCPDNIHYDVFNRRLVINDRYKYIVLEAYKSKAYILYGDSTVTTVNLSKSPYLEDGAFMIPIRELLIYVDYRDYIIKWDNTNKSVEIGYNAVVNKFQPAPTSWYYDLIEKYPLILTNRSN